MSLKEFILPKEENEYKERLSRRFGKHLRRKRLEKGLSQEELAYKSHIYSSYIGHLEGGRYTPSLFVVWKLARALGLRITDFLKDFD